MQVVKKYYRINRNIQAAEVRVLDELGKQVGVLTLSQALQEAQKRETDLVEIVPKAVPPVCKLIDFKRFLYNEEKKEAKERKKTRRSEQKEVWLSPFIAENDLNNHIKKARKFLISGNKLKLVVKFKGRENSKREFGVKVIDKVLAGINDISELNSEPRFLGNRLEAILSPAIKTKKQDETEIKDEKISSKAV